MDDLVFGVVAILNAYLLYLATSHNKNFPYIYIVTDLVSYLLLYYIMDSYPGLMSRTRMAQLLMLGLYVYRSGIKIEGTVKLILVYYAFQLAFHLSLQTGNDTIQASTFWGVFVLGSTIRHDERFEKKIVYMCYFIIGFSALYVYAASQLKFGKVMYGQSFTVGGYGFSKILTVGGAALVLTIIRFKKKLIDFKDLVFILIGTLNVLIIMARAPIIVTFEGLFVALIQQGVKIKNLMYVLIAFVLTYVTVSTFMPSFMTERYKTREGEIEKILDKPEKITRVKEYLFLPEYLSRSDFNKVLFGTGFGPTYPYRRMMIGVWQSSIHTGYVYTIYTLGLTGLMLYLVFCGRLFLKYRRFRKKKLYLKYKFSFAHNLVQPMIAMILTYNIFNYLVPSEWAYLLLLICGKFYREYLEALAEEARRSAEKASLANSSVPALQ